MPKLNFIRNIIICVPVLLYTQLFVLQDVTPSASLGLCYMYKKILNDVQWLLIRKH